MSKEQTSPIKLPVLPLRDQVLFPHMGMPLYVGREGSLEAINAAMKGSREIFVVTQKDGNQNDLTPDDLYETGTICRILNMETQPDGTVKLSVQGLQRAKADLDFSGPYIKAQAQPQPVEQTIGLEHGEEELEVLLDIVMDDIKKYHARDAKVLPAGFTNTLAENRGNPGALADVIAAHMIFLPLEDRTAIANTEKGDLLISLHTNAHRNRGICGVETYILNIALDEDAMNLAARENATSTKNIGDLQMILNDLMLNTKINESSRLAEFVQKGLVKELRTEYKGVHDRGVRQAPFYVLIGAEMPAILVEVGYITNSTENKRLCTEAYLTRTASGIVKGIDSYIKDMESAYRGG